MMNNGGSSASLASVPNALSRWTEEARVLEADSMHDAVTGTSGTLYFVRSVLAKVFHSLLSLCISN